MTAPHALDFPALLDREEAAHDLAIREDDLTAEFAVQAERKWTIKLVEHALARLYFAGEVRGHNEARAQADDAADALHAAGKLAPLPHRAALLRLSARLNEALDRFGHPDGAEIEAASKEAEQIQAALRTGVVR